MASFLPVNTPARRLACSCSQHPSNSLPPWRCALCWPASCVYYRTMPPNEHVDFAVIGGGPAGLAAAKALLNALPRCSVKVGTWCVVDPTGSLGTEGSSHLEQAVMHGRGMAAVQPYWVSSWCFVARQRHAPNATSRRPSWLARLLCVRHDDASKARSPWRRLASQRHLTAVALHARCLHHARTPHHCCLMRACIDMMHAAAGLRGGTVLQGRGRWRLG